MLQFLRSSAPYSQQSTVFMMVSTVSLNGHLSSSVHSKVQHAKRDPALPVLRLPES